MSIQIALAAMLLRALVPAGWMPGAAAVQSLPLVVCTAQGLQKIDAIPHKPADHVPARAHEMCPFAAAANLAPPQSGDALPAPMLISRAASSDLLAVKPSYASQFDPHSPRAPPSFT